jgi:hypothetical protein
MDWVNALAFKLYTGPNGKYVIHMNGKKKTKIDVPRNITNKKMARNWIKQQQAPKVKSRSPPRTAKGNIIGNKFPRVKVVPPEPYIINKVLFNCDTKLFKQVRKSNGATGFLANKVVPLPNRRLYTVRNGSFNIKPGIAKIGSGQQGVVFLGYTSEKAVHGSGVIIKVCPEDKTAPKQVSVVEFDIQKKLYEVVPRHIPKPYALVECKNYVNPDKVWHTNRSSRYDYTKQYVEFSEYATGGSLYAWLTKMSARVTEGLLQSIITQILRSLAKIMRKYPEFRHNDLHLDNVLVKQGAWTKYPTVFLADFGLARLTKKGSNPMVNGAGAANQAGIGPLTSSRYDMHLFLNELQKWIQRNGPARFPKALDFIYRILPEGYRGTISEYINDGRLRYNIPYPGLPSLASVIKDPYILGARQYMNNLEEGPKRLARQAAYKANNSPNVKANILRTPIKPFKFPSPPKSVYKARVKTPSPPRSLPKNLANVSPKTFLKLSPGTKAKVMAARRAKAGAPKAKVMAVPTVANSVTARKKASPRKRINTAAQNVRISPRVLRTNKFNKLRAGLLVNNNRSYSSRWAEARQKAIAVLENRLRRGLPMFTPSPVRLQPLPPPLSPIGPPPARKSPPKAKPAAAGGRAAKNLNMRMNGNRVKLRVDGGRPVYANGAAVSLDYLKAMAARYGVSTKGLRSKADIAKAIFSS